MLTISKNLLPAFKTEHSAYSGVYRSYWSQRARFTLLEFIGVFDKSEHCFSRQFELQQCTGGLNESL
jgi:hypothetical protein